MKDKSLFWSLVALLLFLGSLTVGVAISSYNGYHTRMHCAYTWGRVIETHYHRSKSGYYSAIHYKVGSETYRTYMGSVDCRYQGDSVVVAYDSTRCQRGFVLQRNPHDPETAFFKSEERYLGMKWHNNLEKYKRNLSAKQEAHRRREHFYDYFCRDDH